MKININIDCTPEEARSFMGLPDVAPMQAKMMEQLEAQLQKQIAAMEPEQLLKTWLPVGLSGFEQAQKIFWEQMKAAGQVMQGAGQGSGSTKK